MPPRSMTTRARLPLSNGLRSNDRGCLLSHLTSQLVISQTLIERNMHCLTSLWRNKNTIVTNTTSGLARGLAPCQKHGIWKLRIDFEKRSPAMVMTRWFSFIGRLMFNYNNIMTNWKNTSPSHPLPNPTIHVMTDFNMLSGKREGKCHRHKKPSIVRQSSVP